MGTAYVFWFAQCTHGFRNSSTVGRVFVTWEWGPADEISCTYFSTAVIHNNREQFRITGAAELTPCFLSFREVSDPFLGDDSFQFPVQRNAFFPFDGNSAQVL